MLIVVTSKIFFVLDTVEGEVTEIKISNFHQTFEFCFHRISYIILVTLYVGKKVEPIADLEISYYKYLRPN